MCSLPRLLQVTLVLERAVNSSTPLAPRDPQGPKLAPLQDVVLSDLAIRPAVKGLEEQIDGVGLRNRIESLLSDNDLEGD